MSETLYAVDNGDGEITFNTSGWTVNREDLYDAVSRQIDVLALHEMVSTFALKGGVNIGTAWYDDERWHVRVDDHILDQVGWDDE